MAIIACLCYATAVLLSGRSQHRAREIIWTQWCFTCESVCLSVCLCVFARKGASEWERVREIIFITNWLHFHTTSSGPRGQKLKGQVLSAQTHTDSYTEALTHTLTHTHKHRVTNRESEFGRAGTEEWMQAEVAHHCSRWLAHFHFNYTAQWHCCAYTRAHTHPPWTANTHTCTSTYMHGSSMHAHTHTLHPMNSHQPLLWAVHGRLQTESKEARER